MGKSAPPMPPAPTGKTAVARDILADPRDEDRAARTAPPPPQSRYRPSRSSEPDMLSQATAFGLGAMLFGGD